MRLILPLTVALCLSACAGSGARPAGDGAELLPDLELPYSRFTLANGLTVIVHEDHRSPVVGIAVWYHVGSKDEPPGRHGFAHLFEHLMFEGSLHYDRDYFQALEPAGATDMNGTTNADRTNYFETVPTAALDRALWLESDRMGYLAQSITQAKLDQQRGVVENEKREDENQPYGKVAQIIARETYPPQHPYSWTTIGSQADLDAATLADVKAWFARYYGPNNAVLAIAGDVDTATVKAQVEHYFGALPPGPPVDHVKDWPAPLAADKRLRVYDRVPSPRVYEVWNVPGDGRRDAVLLDMLAQVLGGGKDSRLYQRLVHRDQSAVAVEAALDAREIGGQLMIVATARHASAVPAVERAIREEVQRLLEQGPSADELRRVKISTYAGMVHGLDKVGGFYGRAALLAANQTFHDDPAHYRLELGWEREATPADVRAAAARWLGFGHLTLEVLPQAELAAAHADADRSQLPALAAPASLKLPALQHAVLPNGMKLVLAERHDLPQVDFEMLLDAGRAADAASGAKSGTSALTLDMLDEGAGGLDALAIARRQAQLGATIGVSLSRDVSRVSLSALSSQLPQALALYAQLITEPTFPDAELARVKTRLLAAIAREKAEPFGAARRVLSRLLYGEGHPYAYAGLGLERDVQAITRADLVAFHARWLRPDRATLVVVGDTTLAQLQPLLEKYFGSWHAPSAPPPEKHIAAVPTPAGPRVFLIDQPDATQSLVLAANLAPPGSSPDEIAMQTVQTALGGMFNSRLNLKLREEKHWSYGAAAALVEARGPQIFLAYANVERDHTADALRVMQEQLSALLGARPLTAAEIEAAKQAQVRSLPGDFSSTPGVLGAISQLVEFQRPDDYWNRYVPEVETLDAAALQRAASELVKPADLTWVVVGDLAHVEAPVRALNLGEVGVLDADGRRLR
jgi:zinc protease